MAGARAFMPVAPTCRNPPTPIGALEEQLAALQNTKADMRDLRIHMTGLEDELEQLMAQDRMD